MTEGVVANSQKGSPKNGEIAKISHTCTTPYSITVYNMYMCDKLIKPTMWIDEQQFIYISYSQPQKFNAQ